MPTKKAKKKPAKKGNTERKHPGGRPTVMTPEVIRKLEDGFTKGLSDLEACLYAGIGKTPFYEYLQENPEFAERREMLKNNVRMQAKINIHTEVAAGDARTSQWYLERRDPEYANKSETKTVTLTAAEADLSEEALKRLGQ